MADNTAIEWTDATWNPITGCSVVSPGCTNCYAMRLAAGRLKHTASRAGLTTASKAGPVWNGQVRLNEDALTQPLRWRRPRGIFVCAHGDLFHPAVPDAWIDRVFAVMALSPQHTFQVLTKRADRMRAYALANLTNGCGLDREIGGRFLAEFNKARRERRDLPAFALPLPNVWLGVSVEDQARADERIPDLLATPAAVRFVSAEPLLGAMDLTRVGTAGPFPGGVFTHRHALAGAIMESHTPDGAMSVADIPPGITRLDWVIVGGESGPGARPMHPDWARQIRDDCAAAGVPFFFKQWGASKAVEVIEGDTAGFRYMAADGLADDALRAREDAADSADPTAWYFANVGKTAAGRTLDGALHDAMPGVGG